MAANIWCEIPSEIIDIEVYKKREEKKIQQ